MTQKERERVLAMSREEYLDFLQATSKKANRSLRIALFFIAIQAVLIGANAMTAHRARKFRDETRAISLDIAKQADAMKLKLDQMKRMCAIARRSDEI